MTANDRAGIYVHIPFCIRKCNYCAFVSGPSTAELRDAYIDSLVAEIGLRADKAVSADTVFIGGGTPSLLASPQLERILMAIRDSFDLSEEAEITLEANPATLDREKLCGYRSIGVNRLSMGVQSMDDGELLRLGRIHRSEDVMREFELARSAGFDNINLDLIFAIPGTSAEDAQRSLKRVIALEPEHISYYSLQLEEGTKFYRDFQEGRLREVPDEVDREMYHGGCELLRESGYLHYEISNFAKAGRESRHNSKYWSMADYYGFGLSASSFAAGTRYMNSDDMNGYMRMVAAGTLPYADVHRNTERDTISEAVFTGLRRSSGIRYCDILGSGERFWKYYADVRRQFDDYVDGGYVKVESEGFALTEKGIDISNGIMALFV